MIHTEQIHDTGMTSSDSNTITINDEWHMVSAMRVHIMWLTMLHGNPVNTPVTTYMLNGSLCMNDNGVLRELAL